MKLEIKPAIFPEIRQKMAHTLDEILEGIGYIDGGGTMLDGSSSDIFIYPVDGKTEADVRLALTGHADEGPWPLPEIEPDKLPTEIP